VSLAWETFEKANGAESLDQLRVLIGRHRRHALDPLEDPNIGCIILEQPFFLPESRWIPLSDWKPNIVQGRTYDLSSREGRALWDRLQAALLASNVNVLGTETGVLTGDARPMADLPIAGSMGAEQDRFGPPVLVTPRLGQGAFRIVVTDVYDRRCAVTRERTLPVLEAAHIRPYGEGGEHRVDNGLLLRRDLHTLLDRGYVTVTTDYHLEVSRRIKEEFENGRDYYALHGRELSLPPKVSQRPSPEFLRWHNETRFRG